MSEVEYIGPSSPKQQLMLTQTADTAILGGAMGCLPHDAEFLSESGWKRISEYSEDDMVAQYSPENDSLTFVRPREYIKLPCDSFKRMTARGLDFIMTPEHRVIYWNEGYSHKVIPFADVVERHARSKTKGWAGKIKTTFTVQGVDGLDFSEGELRLQIAVQADGRIVKGGKDNYTQMRFSKERKYKRLISLCTTHGLAHRDNGVKFDPKYTSNKEYEVIVWPKKATKRFDGSWYSATDEQLAIIVDEVRYWDSHVVGNKTTQTVQYSTSIKENADFIQYAFHSQGYNTSINVRRGCEYTVFATLTGKGFRSFANKYGKCPVDEYPSQDGFKYCFVVEDSFFLVRQNNKVFITGNSGKSYISLLYPLKFADDPHLRGIIFRQTVGEIMAQGGLWENACEIYTKIYGNEAELRREGKKGGIKIHVKEMKITFPAGGSIKFGYLESERDLLRHQGAQYTFVLFDEGTHFSLSMVEYLRKRMRSTRAKHLKQMVLTCNPDPDWELLPWIKPYLDEEGTPNLEMDGVLRYYVVDNGEYIWSDTREELEKVYGSGEDSGIQSFTYVSANCTDNIPLMRSDPAYLSNLKAQPYVDVQRYLYGNWYVRPTTSTMFRREWVKEVDQEPPWTEVEKTVRAYDFAFTLRSDHSPSPDYTVSVKMSRLKCGDYFIHDVRRTRILPGDWLKFIMEAAVEDGPKVDIIIPLDPGPGAKFTNQVLTKQISAAGYYVKQMRSQGGKADRFKPFASMAMNGGIQVLENCATDYENGIQNDNNFFFGELERFDGTRKRGEAGHDDLVDACSDAFEAAASAIQIPDISYGLKNLNLTSTNPFLDN